MTSSSESEPDVRTPLRITLCLSLAALGITALEAQPPTEGRPSREVAFELRSAEITRFEPAVRIGSGKRLLTYEEALVFTLEVKRDEYDGLPPSVEPFLYVGNVELRTFKIVREDESRTLLVLFHARDWERLEEGAPMVLTADHGAVAGEPERFDEARRFSRRLVVDTRE